MMGGLDRNQHINGRGVSPANELTELSTLYGLFAIAQQPYRISQQYAVR